MDGNTILLRRRNSEKPFDLSRYLNSGAKLRLLPPIDSSTILKLDRRHVTQGRQTTDVARYSFYTDINEGMLRATLVAYKEDWDDPDCSMTILKFRYATKELDNYLPILKKMPIFEESIDYSNDGHISRITYKLGYRDKITY